MPSGPIIVFFGTASTLHGSTSQLLLEELAHSMNGQLEGHPCGLLKLDCAHCRARRHIIKGTTHNCSDGE